MKCHVCGFEDNVSMFPRVITTIAATNMLIAADCYRPQQSFNSVSLGNAWINKLQYCPKCGTVKVAVTSDYEKKG